ncbi:MAG: glycosyltransferase family 1 protein [Paenibacillaceae bacterium]|nr:glycosyltransferase family 1 protein [Paenibacillaceae bacterium]
MKIVLFTAGTADDVAPFLALAMGLQRLGHRIVLSAPEFYRRTIEQNRVAAQLLYGNVQDIFFTEPGNRWLAAGEKPLWGQMRMLIGRIRHHMQAEILDVCRDGDALIFHPSFRFEASVVSEALRKPILFASPTPAIAVTGNRVNLPLLAALRHKSEAAELNDLRSLFGLGPLRDSLRQQLERQRIPVLHAYSPMFASGTGGRGNHHFVSGVVRYAGFSLPPADGQQPDEEMDAWLDRGPAPIYFGLDGFPVADPRKLIDIVISLTKQLQVRAVIASGWADWIVRDYRLPDSIKVKRSFNLDRLFPRCSCAVHHGGAGATLAALETGTPSVICSSDAEQRFWGERIEAHRVGSHIPLHRLTLNKLKIAVRKLQQESIKPHVSELGDKLKRENGLQAALEWLETMLPIAPVYRNET